MKFPKKVWIKEHIEQNNEGEQLQIVTVYMSEVKGASLVILEK